MDPSPKPYESKSKTLKICPPPPSLKRILTIFFFFPNFWVDWFFAEWSGGFTLPILLVVYFYSYLNLTKEICTKWICLSLPLKCIAKILAFFVSCQNTLYCQKLCAAKRWLGGRDLRLGIGRHYIKRVHLGFCTVVRRNL